MKQDYSLNSNNILVLCRDSHSHYVRTEKGQAGTQNCHLLCLYTKVPYTESSHSKRRHSRALRNMTCTWVKVGRDTFPFLCTVSMPRNALKTISRKPRIGPSFFKERRVRDSAVHSSLLYIPLPPLQVLPQLGCASSLMGRVHSNFLKRTFNLAKYVGKIFVVKHPITAHHRD